MTSTDTLSLKGRKALITGASRGIGRAIALELAHRGAAIVINYNRAEEKALNVLKTIKEKGGVGFVLQADIADYNQAQDLVKKSIDMLEGLDILVNNAGITRDKLIMLIKEEDWDFVQAVNSKGTFNCSKAVIRHMMRKRYGRIINITSVAGQMGNAGQTNYSASKAAQIGFTKALAREVASRNITVNAIAAGYVETDIWANVPNDIRDNILKLIPLGRKGTPEEIAYAVAFLASDQAAYITGQVLGIDGGMAMM